jgi:hypothetical protein
MNNEQASMRKPITLFIIFILLLIVAVFTRTAVAGGPVIKLSPAPALYGQVSQTLLDGTGGNQVLKAIPFDLKNVRYFNNNSWVAAEYVAIDNQSDNGAVLMQKVGSYYVDVLGPGTAFPSNIQQGLPGDVYSYLQSKGLIYEISN